MNSEQDVEVVPLHKRLVRWCGEWIETLRIAPPFSRRRRDILDVVVGHRVMLPLPAVLAGWRDGDELSDGWNEEFDWLRQEHAPRLAELRSSVERDGMKYPILLGTDGRVWDGHHRLCVADMLGLDAVPCEFADRGAVAVYGPGAASGDCRG